MAVRAARLHEIGGVPQVDEVDAPQGGGLVRVSTAALNPIDISIANGRFYGGSPPTPTWSAPRSSGRQRTAAGSGFAGGS